MRKNQKGFTLVELIIAIAIMAIVTLSVCGFIVVGSRSYTSANTDIMLQQEAQLALNQISDVIIDTTESINYGSGTEMVLKDSEFSSEPDEKDLVVINGHGGLAPTDSSLQNNNLCYQFEWRKDTETIYFRDSEAVITESHPKPDEDEWNDWAILAQHVKELHIDISQFEENRVVMVSMTFENGNREYTTSNNITVRNRVAINKIDVDPMKKAQEFTITTVQNVTLEPGDNFNLADKTQVMTTSDDDAVKWELVDPGTTTSTISPDGQLSIGTGETRQSFLVRVSRENEEYENQNKKVSKTVKVNIKRVNSVDLSCSATTVKAGSTITINGTASGYMLGASCEAHSCLGDDETKDHDLVPDRWRIVRGPATIVDDKRGVKEVEIKISTSAKKGDEIEIEATSYLSTIKSYGTVTGTLVLKVTEGANGAKFIGSDLKFGTDNDPGIFDYMRTSLRTDHGRYVFCVRVREAGTVGCQNDYIMVYFTEGANERFSPDAFGLDHRKSYEVYFQVLDPRPKGSSVEASKEEIKNEYLNSDNLDDNGKYIGTKFDADEYYYGVLNPPSVAVTINGVTYPNDEKESFEHFSFLSTPDANPLPGMINIADAGAINIWREAVLNNIRFTVYKEEAGGRWKRVYGYDQDTEEYADYRSGTTRSAALSISPDENGSYKKDYTGQRTFGRIEFQPGEDPTVKNLSNSSAWDIEQACGTYHIVAGYIYANKPDIRTGAYTGDNVIYKYVQGDYNTYYYKQWDCVVNLKIDAGLNLQLPDGKDWSGNNEERWTNFPVPSDRAFPFDLKSQTEQKISYNFTEYSKNAEWRGSMSDVTVTCEYNGQRDVYLITLSSMEVNVGERKIITHIYGKYESRMGQDNWTRVGLEETKVTNIKTNLEFRKDNTDYEAYFPTPNDADFPSGDVFDNSREIKDWQLISFSKTGDNSLVENCIVKCSKPDNKYTIEIIRENLTGNPHMKYEYNYGTFEWNGAGWQRTKEGSNTGTPVAVWGTIITFEKDNTKYKIEVPLPSEEGFPSFQESCSIREHKQFFLESDTFGDQDTNLYTDWRGIGLDYSYNASTGVYTLKLVNANWTAQTFGTWTCTRNGTEWTRVN